MTHVTRCALGESYLRLTESYAPVPAQGSFSVDVGDSIAPLASFRNARVEGVHQNVEAIACVWLLSFARPTSIRRFARKSDQRPETTAVRRVINTESNRSVESAAMAFNRTVSRRTRD